MTYVMSDVHGEYDRYEEMLSEIGFADDDTLYIIGDVLDRTGDGGIDILLDIMGKKNITLIVGNHEEIALEGMVFLMEEATFSGGIDGLDAYCRGALTEWITLGGMYTIDAFQRLSRRDKLRVVRYLQRSLTYAEIIVAGVDYVLAHDESYYDYWDGSILVTGHVPTRFIDGNPKPDHIWRDDDHFHIDCGCGFGGKLGVLCLDDFKEYYV